MKSPCSAPEDRIIKRKIAPAIPVKSPQERLGRHVKARINSEGLPEIRPNICIVFGKASVKRVIGARKNISLGAEMIIDVLGLNPNNPETIVENPSNESARYQVAVTDIMKSRNTILKTLKNLPRIDFSCGFRL
tara:strand:- start:13 stop:414 length:402 start_codon:yes stop_codon:yes gene_type:complete